MLLESKEGPPDRRPNFFKKRLFYHESAVLYGEFRIFFPALLAFYLLSKLLAYWLNASHGSYLVL